MACHDEQNGDQSFSLQARIAKLSRKVEKVKKKDRLAIFKPQTGFFGCGREWHNFQ